MYTVLKYAFLLFSFATAFQLSGFSQASSQEKREAVKALIGSRDFRFMAQSAISRGNTIPVDPGYTLKVMNDSLLVDLPFFGAAYSNNFGGSDDNLKYGSKAFSYATDSTKKGAWNITIVPKTETRISRIYLNVTPDGDCTLRINTTNQPPAVYHGILGDNLSP